MAASSTSAVRFAARPTETGGLAMIGVGVTVAITGRKN